MRAWRGRLAKISRIPDLDEGKGYHRDKRTVRLGEKDAREAGGERKMSRLRGQS